MLLQNIQCPACGYGLRDVKPGASLPNVAGPGLNISQVFSACEVGHTLEVVWRNTPPSFKVKVVAP